MRWVKVVWISIGVVLGVLTLKTVQLIKNRRNDRVQQDDEYRIYPLLEHAKDIIYYVEIEPIPRYRYLSPSIDTALGEQVLEETFENPFAIFDRIHPEDYNTLERKINGQIDFNQPIIQRWKHNNGNYIWFEEHATPIYRNEKLVALQGVIRNISDKVELMERLEYQISHDRLTGIYNRDFFENYMKKYDQTDDSVAMVLCDLDNLKKINDTFGHKQGDELIQNTATLLSSLSQSDITVCRVGGDEFALLLTNTSEAEVKLLVNKLIDQLKHFNETTKFPIYLSLGYAYRSNSRAEMENMYMEADQWMYEHKNNKEELPLV
ncbi:diguanylate cyclase [Pontibacillus yanchengensis]|uniref:Diguanylate cyclase n=1 Tax=Pontibacillus yanchengensis TaxID=462910 RepID=A0ACC7VIW6_9BACI|nr:diguanylate cyclase [Pontibacillus yanchengensis]